MLEKINKAIIPSFIHCQEYNVSHDMDFSPNNRTIEYDSAYVSSIPQEMKDNFFSHMNNLLKDCNERVNFLTPTIFIKESFEMQGSLAAFFFKEYISTNSNTHLNTVVKTQRDLTEDIAIKTRERLSLPHDLYMEFNIPSATLAILATVTSLMEIGDSILVMQEDHGGHYSQGSKSRCSGKSLVSRLFKVNEFSLNMENNQFDYDILESAMEKHKPKVLLLGFSSYCGLIDFPKVRKICDKYNSFFIFDASHTIGLMLCDVIPHSFHHAHMTVASTYKTIPANRGGIMITECEKLREGFVNSLTGLQVERGLNLVTASYLGILECLTPAYRMKMKKALEIAKYIENFFNQPSIMEKGYRKIISTEIHMITIDCGFDIKEILGIFKECNLDISTFFVPNTNRYGLRFICTTAAILEYSLEEIHEILEVVLEILDGKENMRENIPLLSDKIRHIALKRPVFLHKKIK